MNVIVLTLVSEYYVFLTWETMFLFVRYTLVRLHAIYKMVALWNICCGCKNVCTCIETLHCCGTRHFPQYGVAELRFELFR